jgi:hypothetical protein
MQHPEGAERWRRREGGRIVSGQWLTLLRRDQKNLTQVSRYRCTVLSGRSSASGASRRLP